MRTPGHRNQRGAAAVEMAIISGVLVTLLLGIVEMGRLLWAWNAAVEATRLGARLAVVCSMDTTSTDRIKNKMRQMLPYLQTTNIAIDYLNPPNAVNSCTDLNCKSVRVTLSGYTHRPIMMIPLNLSIPTFQTTLPREFMQTANNAICN